MAGLRWLECGHTGKGQKTEEMMKRERSQRRFMIKWERTESWHDGIWWVEGRWSTVETPKANRRKSDMQWLSQKGSQRRWNVPFHDFVLPVFYSFIYVPNLVDLLHSSWAHSFLPEELQNINTTFFLKHSFSKCSNTTLQKYLITGYVLIHFTQSIISKCTYSADKSPSVWMVNGLYFV